MPPLLRSYKNLENHPCRELFLEAIRAYLQTYITEKAPTWEEVEREAVGNAKLLNCIWVFTYKFDKYGRFVKAKARLVVRGNKQRRDPYESTFAAILTGKSFRSVVALAAKFDLYLI